MDLGRRVFRVGDPRESGSVMAAAIGWVNAHYVEPGVLISPCGFPVMVVYNCNGFIYLTHASSKQRRELREFLEAQHFKKDRSSRRGSLEAT